MILCHASAEAMHEIGIAAAIIEAGQAEAARRPGSKVVCIGVRVGVLSGVDNDALRFAFNALVAGTDLESWKCEIENCRRRNRCQECGYEFESDVYDASCPRCAFGDIVLVGGDELELAYVEVEET
jgi:hydrogenase nickel incorporation protein HypA/HybF